MFFVFLLFSETYCRNLTYEGIKIKYGLDRNGYAYFGSRYNPTNTTNLTFDGKLLLPEAIRIKNMTFPFKLICERAFANIPMKSIFLPTTLEWIAASAFENCTRLEEVDASETNISVIDDRVFRNCSNLKIFKFPKVISVIGARVFEYTLIQDIQNMKFTGIDDFTFANNPNLKIADLSSSSIKIIPTSLFENCTSLSKIFLPKNLFWIKSFAFANTNISEVLIPQELTLIHKYVFSSCHRIEKADLRKCPVKCVSDGLFHNCVNLKEVILPEVCYWVGSRAFFNTKIKNVEIPVDCYSIGEYSFAQCPYLESVDMSNSVVEELLEGAFFNSSKLFKLKVSKQLSSLGADVFYNTDIKDLGDLLNISHINSSTFRNSKIETLNLQKCPIKHIPDYAFYQNKYIRTVNLPNTTISIGKYVFSETLIDNISLAASILSIDEGSFMNCQKLYEIYLTMPNLTLLMPYMFANCQNLVVVRIPKHLHALKNACFFNCSNLECVYGSRRLRIIGPYSFYNCTSLVEVNFSKIAVHYIDESAFENCVNLTKFTMNFQTIGTGPKAFANTNLTSMEFFHSIGTFCLANCKNLVTVVLNRSTLTVLNSALFDQCISLKTVYLPKMITYIGPTVFRGCTNLQEIYYKGQCHIKFAALPDSAKVFVTLKYNSTKFGNKSVIVIYKE